MKKLCVILMLTSLLNVPIYAGPAVALVKKIIVMALAFGPTVSGVYTITQSTAQSGTLSAIDPAITWQSECPAAHCMIRRCDIIWQHAEQRSCCADVSNKKQCEQWFKDNEYVDQMRCNKREAAPQFIPAIITTVASACSGLVAGHFMPNE